jgi:hypothetical protein
VEAGTLGSVRHSSAHAGGHGGRCPGITPDLSGTIAPAGADTLNRQPVPGNHPLPIRKRHESPTRALTFRAERPQSLVLAQRKPFIGPAVWWLSGPLDLPGNGSLRHESLRSPRRAKASAWALARWIVEIRYPPAFPNQYRRSLCRRGFAAGPRVAARTHLRIRETPWKVNGFCKPDERQVECSVRQLRSIHWTPRGEHGDRSRKSGVRTDRFTVSAPSLAPSDGGCANPPGHYRGNGCHGRFARGRTPICHGRLIRLAS